MLDGEDLYILENSHMPAIILRYSVAKVRLQSRPTVDFGDASPNPLCELAQRMDSAVAF